MFWTKIKMTTLTVVCVALLGTGAGVVSQRGLGGNVAYGESTLVNAEGEGEKEGKTLKGVLKEIDVDKGTLVLTTNRDGEGMQDQKLNLAGKDIKITTNVDRVVKLDQLKPGFKLAVTLSAAGDVSAIQVEVPKGAKPKNDEREGDKKKTFAQGIIKGVDADKHLITLAMKVERMDSDVQFEVAKGAKFALAGKEKTVGLADLKEGDKIALELGEKKLVVGGKVGEFIKEGDRPKGELPPVSGELVSVDKDKQTITLKQKTRDGDVNKTLDLAKDVKISLVGEKKGTLDDLKPGSKLTLIVSKETKAVTSIRPYQPDKGAKGLPATIKKVDAKELKITVGIRGDGGQEKEKTFNLHKDVKIFIPRVDGTQKISDLKEGQQVLLQLTEDRQTVTTIRLTKEGGQEEEE